MKKQKENRQAEERADDLQAAAEILTPEVAPEALIKSLIADSGVLEGKWTKKMWRSLALHLADGWIAERKAFNIYKFAGFRPKYRMRQQQDAQRISNRKDQIDKIAFQAAIKDENYTTKAEAIRDMRVNKQFEDYNDKTLRGWITPDVWKQPVQRGRPRKSKPA
jgi:hypothetical protein